VLWARRSELADEIRSARQNAAYLPGFAIPPGVAVTDRLPDAVRDAEFVVMAVPSHGFRAVFAAVAPSLAEGAAVVSLAKGLEEHTLLRMSEIVDELAPGRSCAVLTGPNLVPEIAAGLPAAAVAASSDAGCAEDVQRLFSVDGFRVYTNDDVVGSELAGALKNVIAVAIGMADGLELGVNAKAALITRGLAELTRLGVAMGGDPMTFSGLAGLGDLVATCTSPLSRNRRFGEELARGRTRAQIEGATAMVAEGVRTSGAVTDLARRAGVEMPIAGAVAAVIARECTPEEATHSLMGRELRPERHGWSER